ncbi:MAG: YfhO family protein [Candidatus Marinimicrobia bacterium]|nr:YfhO family protein [Candidatus Neomarinimicrobiota bacterium]
MNKYLLIIIYSLWIMLFFYPVIFYDNIFGSGDTLNPYSVNHILDVYKSKIGHWPLWQPWIFSGMPTMEAFTYINELYFPTRLMIGVGISDLNIQLIHLVFSGIGMYLLLEQFKIDRLISFSIGLLWILNPYLITMIVFGHGSQMMTAAYIPWVLYGVNRLKDSISIESLVLLSLLIGFQLQRGHVQIAYYSCMLIGAYFLYSFIRKKHNKNKYLLYFIISCGLGFLLASHIYYPSLDYLDSSIRSGGNNHYQYATNWSMHPKELLTYLFPYYYGFGGSSYSGYMPFTDYPNYVGFFIVLSALFSFIKLNTQKIFFISILLLSIFLSFGKYFNILYDFFYSFFPYFSNFRVPSMILIISNFTLYILAAFGLKDIISRILNIDRFRKLELKTIVSLFLLLSIIDIYRVDKNIISPSDDSAQKSQIISTEKFNSFFEEDEAIKFLKNDLDLYRVYAAGELFQDPKLKFHGIQSVGGYHPAKFRHYTDLLNETNNLLSIPVLRFLNVKYLLSPVELNHKDFELSMNTPYNSAFGEIDLNIYRLKNNLERAWFVKSIIKEDKNLYNYLTATAFDSEKIAIVKDLESQSFSQGEVISLDWNIHEISIDVNVFSESAFLVLSEINYPERWKATVDNKDVRIYQTNGVLRGLLLNEGTHSIVFKYDDNLFKSLLILSNIILFSMFFILIKPFLMRLLKEHS